MFQYKQMLEIYTSYDFLIVYFMIEQVFAVKLSIPDTFYPQTVTIKEIHRVINQRQEFQG